MRGFAQAWFLLLAVLLAMALLSSGCASTAQNRYHATGTSFTRQGVGVMDPAHVLKAPLDDVVQDVATWWAFRYPDKAQAIVEWLSLSTISVEASDEPLRDPQYPRVGPARGLTYGRNVRALWFTPTRGADFESIVRHELGHVIARVIPHPGMEDHDWFAYVGFPWK